MCNVEKCNITNLILTDSFFKYYRDISQWLMQSTYLNNVSLVLGEIYQDEFHGKQMEIKARKLIELFKVFSDQC